MQICDPARTVDERVLESFVEALLDPCVVVSRTGRVLAANSQWKQLPRRNEAAIAASNPIGIDYLALFQASILPEDCASLTGNIEAILSGQNREFEREYIRRVPHGIRWFRMTVRAWPQMDASAIIFHRDITDEKFGRENTQSVDEQFRALADSAPMLIWMSGPDKGCTFFNRRWLEFTGVPVADQLGEGWLELVHPDDRRAIMQTYERAFDGAREFEFDYRVRHHAGDYRWIRDNGSPRFDADNRLIGFIGSAWDMSDQMRATEEATVVSRYANLVRDMAAAANRAPSMREALQRSLDLICEAMNFPVGHALLIHDDEPELAKSAHIVYVKDMARFGKLFELSSTLTWPVEIGAPGEVLRTGKPLYTDVVRNAEEPDRYPRAAASLEAGLVGGIHIPILVDDRVEAIVEFGSEKQVIGDSALADVLTAAIERLARFFERRRAQINLMQQNQELQASADRLFAMAARLVSSQEDERRRIAREIHDDFTQRLALVSMRIGRLAGHHSTSTTAELDSNLEDLRTSTASVANDLRELSHQLHPAILELLGFCSAMQSQCQELQRTSGIEVDYHATVVDRDVSPEVSTCLYRVLQESLRNAAKHSGTSRVDVSIERNADQIEMSVRDQGRGFAVGGEKGTGLGLLNMEERVGLLHGNFHIDSTPGVGTEIVVQLPAATRV